MNVIWCREDRCNVARGLRVPFFFPLTFELVGNHLQEEPPLLLSFTLLRIKYQTLTSAATATLLHAAEVLFTLRSLLQEYQLSWQFDRRFSF